MQQGRVIEMDATIALSAARISIDYQLPMADSIILATSRLNKSTLWTQDIHFEGMEGVKYRKKQ
jgi:predicted nucleic acid-binding protein